MKILRHNTIRSSPIILTGVGVSGVVTTAILAVRATPKALYLIDHENMDLDYDGEPPLTNLEKAKLTWKLYLPAIISGGLTIACIISANNIHLRRNAALVGLYTLTETSLREYQDKVVELVGKNKELKIREGVAEDKLKKNPVEGKQVIITGNGETLFFDSLSGRYFKSDMEAIRKTVNDFNELLLGEMYQTLNEWYDLLGLEEVEMGKDTGWEANTGLLKLDYSAKLATNSVPCIVLEYKVGPRNL